MKLAVLGVGLIGGSIGLAARRRAGGGAGIHVTGYDPDASALSAALDAGAIDSSADAVADAVRDADIVFVAAPVGVLPKLIGEALSAAGPACVVSDVGSTKLAVVDATCDPRFIGGHPLAGAETAGVANAREDLFDGAVWYLVPGPETARASIERVSAVVKQLGGTPAIVDAVTHDRLMACVSHLPHVIANVLVDETAGALFTAPDDVRPHVFGVGPSFRDATRVAGANAAIWTDIYMSNRAALIEAIDEAVARLQEVRSMLAKADPAALRAWCERAQGQRDALRQMTASGS